MRTTLCLIALTACSSTSTQSISGRVGTGFPNQVTSVHVVSGTTLVAQAPVAADGTFQLAIPPGSNLSLRFVGNGHTDLVFPRSAGTIDATFHIRGVGVPFDLGRVNFVGPASSTPFVFKTAAEQEAGCDDDNHDANGATCVDDEDNEAGTCEDDDDDEADDAESDVAGAMDDEGEDVGDAVAEHNFPADGCADGDDNGGDDD